VAGSQIFTGVEARLSRFSYLVSLLPDQIITDLDLGLELRSRAVASYTPVEDRGLLVERPEGARTPQSFAELTGSDREHQAWSAFEADLHTFAAAVAPTLTGPSPGPASSGPGWARHCGPGWWSDPSGS